MTDLNMLIRLIEHISIVLFSITQRIECNLDKVKVRISNLLRSIMKWVIMKSINIPIQMMSSVFRLGLNISADFFIFIIYMRIILKPSSY